MLDSPPIAPPGQQLLRRRTVRRVVLAVITAGWIIGGFIGTYSYVDNYYLHRGFATPQRLAEAGSGRLLSMHFYSAALHKVDSYLIYLPSGYSRTRRYPVFYLLHGLPGRSVSFTVIGHIEVRMENLISQHRMGPMILVFPDGRINGDTYSDSEWANTGAGRAWVVPWIRCPAVCAHHSRARVCASASSFTGTRAPYCPDDRMACSIGSIPASSSAQKSESSRSSWPVARARSQVCMNTSAV